jgi:hypothetical protein
MHGKTSVRVDAKCPDIPVAVLGLTLMYHSIFLFLIFIQIQKGGLDKKGFPL